VVYGSYLGSLISYAGRNDTNMVIFESIDDPQGQYGEFGIPGIHVNFSQAQA
jgi:hypothetical protein